MDDGTLSKQEARLRAFERQTDLPMLALSLAFVALLVLPWVWGGAGEYGGVLGRVEWMIWGIFAVELSARIYLAPRKVQYTLRHWFDVVIVLFPFLRPLRLLRGLRLIGLFARTGTTWRRLLRRRGLQYVLMGGLGVMVASAFAVHQAEAGHAESPIQDLADALWWAATTVTTVGYGDTYPTTPAGRGIGVALMLVGIGIFGLITANVAAFFVQEDDEDADARVLAALGRIETRLDRLESATRGQHQATAPEG